MGTEGGPGASHQRLPRVPGRETRARAVRSYVAAPPSAASLSAVGLPSPQRPHVSDPRYCPRHHPPPRRRGPLRTRPVALRLAGKPDSATLFLVRRQYALPRRQQVAPHRVPGDGPPVALHAEAPDQATLVRGHRRHPLPRRWRVAARWAGEGEQQGRHCGGWRGRHWRRVRRSGWRACLQRAERDLTEGRQGVAE